MAAEQVGIKVVVLDVIEDGGNELTEKRREFYTAMGFESLSGRPLRMFIGIETIRRAISNAGGVLTHTSASPEYPEWFRLLKYPR